MAERREKKVVEHIGKYILLFSYVLSIYDTWQRYKSNVLNVGDCS